MRTSLQVLSIFKRFLSHTALYPVVALCVGISLCILSSVPKLSAAFYEQISWRATDLIIRAGGYFPPDPRIVILAINDKALSEELAYGGRLEEWDRSVYGHLIKRLNKAGARAIVFDILFLGAGSGDENFANAIQESSIPIILNVAKDETTGRLAKPPNSLYVATNRNGHANVLVDHDLVVRRIQSTVSDDQFSIPPLGLSAASAYWQLPKDVSIADSLREGSLPNGVSLKTDASDNFLVNFTSPNAFTTCEFSDFMQANSLGCTDEVLHNKIVFVGWSLSAADDYYLTPTGPMNGVEIHANLAASLLNDSLLSEQSKWSRYLLLIVAALLVGIFFTTKENLLILIMELLSAASIIGLGLFLYQVLHIRVDMAGPLLSMMAANGVLLTIQNITQRKEKGRVLELFKNQTSPQIVNLLLKAAENGNLNLGGEERLISIVFFDMRNFTKISEYLAPEQVVEIINTYISIITDCLIEKGGTLTNYAGDQVMALFNAPLPIHEHTEMAINAAQFTMNKIEAFNQTKEAERLPVKAHFGAGVESGKVIVGNIGSSKHYSYTAMGDAVNVAARLCDLAPPSNVYIGGAAMSLVSEQCRRQVVPVGGRNVKGRRGTVQIYRSSHTVHPIQPLIYDSAAAETAETAETFQEPTEYAPLPSKPPISIPVMGK